MLRVLSSPSELHVSSFLEENSQCGSICNNLSQSHSVVTTEEIGGLRVRDRDLAALAGPPALGRRRFQDPAGEGAYGQRPEFPK